MKWESVDFKGKTVWAKLDESGAVLVEGGRVQIRYSEGKGAKIYRGSASNLKRVGGAVKELEGGGPAAASKKSAKTGAGRTSDAAAERAALSSETIVCYTDGSCRGNPGPAGAGALVSFPDGRRLELARSLGQGTNNIGELTAIGLAFEALDEAEIDPQTPVAIFTDSSYSIGVLSKNWKAKKNVELIASLRSMIKPWANVKWIWVKGHAGIPGNERADVLANMGTAGTDRHEWLQT